MGIIVGMNLRRILVLAGLAGVAVAVILNRGQLHQFLSLLHQVRWYVLVLVIAVQLFSYWSNAKLYQTMLKAFGYKVEFRKLYELSLVVNFVNQVFPSGGLSAASFMSRSLHADVPVGKTTLVQLARQALTYLSFLIVLIIGFLMLFFGGGINKLAVRLILLLVLVVLLVSFVLLAILYDRALVERLVHWLLRHFGRFVRWLTKKPHALFTPGRVQRFLDEFYEGFHLITGESRRLMQPLFYALAGNVAEVMTIYVVFLAFGHVVNLGAVIAAYTLANIFSLLGVFTGGIGVYEATMVATMVALGIPLTLSLPVVAVYRGFNMLVFLPVGFYYYHKRLWPTP